MNPALKLSLVLISMLGANALHPDTIEMAGAQGKEPPPLSSKTTSEEQRVGCADMRKSDRLWMLTNCSPPFANETRALLNEYQELRNKRRQLPPGTFDHDLSGYGGRLHQVLSRLQQTFGKSLYTKAEIVKYLGEPDAIKSGTEMRAYLEVRDRYGRNTSKLSEAYWQRREFLIYFWRGWHDFMFFTSINGAIVDSGWWFAYE